MTTSQRSRGKRLELMLERWMWRFRLIAILPVMMSLLSSLATFLLGTKEIVKALLPVGGIDLYLIGIAFLIFGYGVNELLISPIDPARDAENLGNGLLDIRNLDQLKEKLVKVLVVALIVSAFKAMLTLPINTPTSLVLFCLSVLLLVFSGWLVAAESPPRPAQGRLSARQQSPFESTRGAL
jgi:uncharacterized membrane protein YqhA